MHLRSHKTTRFQSCSRAESDVRACTLQSLSLAVQWFVRNSATLMLRSRRRVPLAVVIKFATTVLTQLVIQKESVYSTLHNRTSEGSTSMTREVPVEPLPPACAIMAYKILFSNCVGSFTSLQFGHVWRASDLNGNHTDRAAWVNYRDIEQPSTCITEI
jgi:hypothetical protein